MRYHTHIGLSLGRNFVPSNLAFYYGVEQDRIDNAIRRAQEQATTEAFEALINSDIRTKFCYKMLRLLRSAEKKIMWGKQWRNVDENDARETLRKFREIHRYYQERLHYFLDKMDRSAEIELSRHFWYYDSDTDEVVDDDTGKRYRV